ncbi:MAG: hypothetical protein HY691_16485 [Chloroflexi bacterium]|nr:hypothetical protein [Chloroflexota bacterium]
MDLYAEMVQSLPLYRDREEVINLFVMREFIEKKLDRTPLAGAAIQQLERADTALTLHSTLLRQRFRDLFRSCRPSDVPRSYWWWYLDEGPQVREQARALAQRS